MSSPTQVPYARPYRPRSISGPLFLIAIGVFALLGKLGVISWHGFWWGFVRYWPVVLIVVGVIKLGEYYWARQHGYPAPRLGAGLTVLVVFLVLGGISASRVNGVNWRDVGKEINVDNDPDVEDFFSGIFGTRYDFTDSFSQPVTNAAQVKIICNRGDIKIRPSQDAQAHAVIQKALRSQSQDSANQLNEQTHPKFQQQGNILLLDLTSGNYTRGQFDIDLELPANAPISVSTRHGNIEVSQRDGAVDLTTEHGDLSLDEIKGDAALHLRRGSLTAKKITGNLMVDGLVNDSTINDVTGTVTMTGTYFGDLDMARVARQVRFTTSRTDLQFARLEGEFNMQPDELRANSIVGPFRLETRSKGVHLQDVTGDVHIDNRNAAIELRPKGPMGNIDVSNVHGEIDLTVPANAGFRLDAESMGGEIQTDFKVDVDNSHRDATAKGVVGKGGPDVRLKADHGTIQIRKE